MQRDGLSVLTNMWERIYAQWNNVEESLLQSNFLFVSGVLPLISIGFEQGAKNKRFYLQGIYLERGLEKLRKIRFDNREEMVFFFKNLGDETRFKVLELISQGIGTNKETGNIGLQGLPETHGELLRCVAGDALRRVRQEGVGEAPLYHLVQNSLDRKSVV